MNQEKIGKFIAQKRKEKGLKQSDISKKLGVTDKSVSNWERGKNMPDLSLFNPLCELLDVSINELLNGEENNDKYEQTIIDTINYSDNKIKKMVKMMCFIIMILGLLITIISLTIFSWHIEIGNLYSIIGIILILIGTIKLTKNFKWVNRLIYCFGIIFIFILLICFIDIVNVKYNNNMPRFPSNIINDESGILYDTPLYDVYSCKNKKNNIIKLNSALAVDNIKEICSE